MHKQYSSLQVKELKVSLQKQEVLHGLNLDVKEKEFVSILGPSGCGKTTLLKSIAGLVETDSGSICMNGQPVMEVPPEKRGTIIVFQDLRLFPHMTAEKNIAFPMELHKVPKKEQKETVKKLLLDVQLEGYENRKVNEMSGGERQRVALARALAADPNILLLDEPFSGLDEKLRMEMGGLVKKLHEERCLTTLLVTHDKREALMMSDRIALMNSGEILQYDTPKQIFYHSVSKEAAEYFGKVNYIKGTVEKGKFISPLLEMETDHKDGPCEVMVRPFSVMIKEEGPYEVTEAVFMGELADVLIDTPYGVIRSQMMSRELDKMGLKTGKKVGIEIDEAYCI